MKKNKKKLDKNLFKHIGFVQNKDNNPCVQINYEKNVERITHKVFVNKSYNHLINSEISSSFLFAKSTDSFKTGTLSKSISRECLLACEILYKASINPSDESITAMFESIIVESFEDS